MQERRGSCGRPPRVIPANPLTSFPRTREPRAIKTTVPSRPSPTPVRYRGNGVLCFSLGSRVRGNDGMRAGTTLLREPRALPSFPRTREPRAIKTTVPTRPAPTPVRYRGNGVLCFTLGSRVRGNDGMRAGTTECVQERRGSCGNPPPSRHSHQPPRVIPADPLASFPRTREPRAIKTTVSLEGRVRVLLLENLLIQISPTRVNPFDQIKLPISSRWPETSATMRSGSLARRRTDRH